MLGLVKSQPELTLAELRERIGSDKPSQKPSRKYPQTGMVQVHP